MILLQVQVPDDNYDNPTSGQMSQSLISTNHGQRVEHRALAGKIRISRQQAGSNPLGRAVGYT